MLHGNVNENYRKGDRLSSSRISSNDHRFFRYIFYYIIVQCLRNLGGGPAVVRRHNPFFYPPDTDLFRPPAGDKTTIRWINHVRPVILTENLRSVLHLYKKMR